MSKFHAHKSNSHSGYFFLLATYSGDGFVIVRSRRGGNFDETTSNGLAVPIRVVEKKQGEFISGHPGRILGLNESLLDLPLKTHLEIHRIGKDYECLTSTNDDDIDNYQALEQTKDIFQRNIVW